MHKCILVFAPEVEMRAALARTLMPLGYSVEVASSERTARQLTRTKRFAAAVMAARSAAADDFSLVHGLRDSADKLVLLADGAGSGERLARSFPEALVCSSRQLDHEKLCDFLARPAHKAYEHAAATKSEFLRFADRTLDVKGRMCLDANGREVALTRGEFALLVAFARNSGHALSRAHLRNAMDGGSLDAYDRSIDMLVARLRRKIEPEARKPQLIITVPGVGYKFVPQVRRESTNTAPSASQDVSQITGAEEAPRAERRQITVLSCQILGFAVLASKMDPEELDTAIRPVYVDCAEVIARFGGTVIRTLADSVLAYFGYPKAHESDAANAVRCGMELLRTIREIKVGAIAKLRARVGIATGLMFVRELKSTGARDAGGMGEALNLALHMQKAAPADGVVISADTRMLIGRLFQCREIAAVNVELGSESAPAWHVFEETVGLPRFEGLRRDGTLRLVGREVEIERLQHCWSRVFRGSGQVVLVTGDAGIGKSRLATEFEARLSGEPHDAIRYWGSPHRSDAPMAVLIEELQRSAGFAASDAVSLKVKNLQAEFALLGPVAAEAVALGCTLLGLPHGASSEVAQLSPQKRKEKTFAMLLARIEALAARHPLLAVVEDAHWVDPTSLEFISLLAERTSAMRLLLVIIARPEFVPPWPGYSYLTTLTLPRLSRADSALLMQQIAGERRISVAVESDIIARGDGIPLFVEELTKAVLEYSTEHGGPHARASLIPASLQALLLARLDRLDSGKWAAQAGAVIGREFSYELLHMVAGLDEDMLASALEELVSSGLIFRRGAPPQVTFVFKHALVRDAAYEMLPRSERQKLHAKAAQALELDFPEVALSQPELLAYHFREAGQPLKSIGYLIAAAENALLRSASAEAMAVLTQGRALTATVPEGDERLQLELKLQITGARALLATRGYTAPETRAAYRRARERCEALGDEAWLPLIIHGQWLSAWIAADHLSALEEARQLCLWGERNREQVGLAVGNSDLGMTLTTLGQLREARRHLDEALQINKFALQGRQPFVASDVDGRISTLSFMHNCLLLLGFPDQAEAVAREAAALIPDNLYSRGLALLRLLRMHIFTRDSGAAIKDGDELLRLAEQQGYSFLTCAANVYLGWALAQSGDSTGGIVLCQNGLSNLRAVGAASWLPFHLALLAECYERANDYGRAMVSVTEALRAIEVTGERVWQAEILRLKGRLLLHARAEAMMAQACFVEALHIAREQEAKLLELRAALGLADLLANSGRPAEAHAALAPVYASFTEGFDFIDMREAKALLDSLSIGERELDAGRRADGSA